MKKMLPVLLALLMLVISPVIAAPVIGEQAPAFTATDSNGNNVNLSDYKGKAVVLEWSNHGCPFVKKHYDSNNMQALQKRAAEDSVAWLTIISSVSGKQGHVDGPAANELTTSRGAVPTAVLLDASGDVGRLYQAKTTPHMFIIDKNGVLTYRGAIDSISSTDQEDIAKAENYVTSALTALKTGQSVATSSTTSYGCAVKY